MPAKIIDFEFYFCSLCGYRVTKFWHKHLVQDKQCPNCNHGTAGEFLFFTCNPEKYAEKEQEK